MKTEKNQKNRKPIPDHFWGGKVTVVKELPEIDYFPKDWREQIRAHLAAEVEAGGTLYGVRSDGAYIARTRDGDRIIRPPVSESS